MRCPACDCSCSLVFDTRNKGDETVRWRRHRCKNCSLRFTTYEISEKVYENSIRDKKIARDQLTLIDKVLLAVNKIKREG